MRITTLAIFASVLLGQAAAAQDSQSHTTNHEIKTDDQKSAEVKTLIEQGRVRQRAADRRNMQLWERWTYAVCIGCGWTPRNVRVVHTNPLRVLAGIPAADDDARELAGRRI